MEGRMEALRRTCCLSVRVDEGRKEGIMNNKRMKEINRSWMLLIRTSSSRLCHTWMTDRK